MQYYPSLFCILSAFVVLTAPLAAVQQFFVPYAIGFLPAEESDIVYRDRETPSLYDKNRWQLMRQRDRFLLRHGECYPPPEVLVSPNLTIPAPIRGEFDRYDPRNSRYRTR